MIPSLLSAPSMAESEVEGGPHEEEQLGRCLVSCTTFNILAPIYKRLDQQVCVSCLFWLIWVLFLLWLLLLLKYVIGILGLVVFVKGWEVIRAQLLFYFCLG